MTSQEAIGQLARHFRTGVRKAKPPLLDELAAADTRFRRGSLRFTALAMPLAVLLEVHGFMQAPGMKFSLNHGEEFGQATPIDTIGATIVLAYSSITNLETLRPWLNGVHHRTLLGALGLHPEECVHVYQNGIAAWVRPESAVPDLVIRLEAIIAALPPDAPEEALEGLAHIPEHLRHLTTRFADWAISDDEERARKLGHASKARLRKFREAVEPLLPDIGKYLSSFGNQPLTLAAIRPGDLAQAVAEIRAGEP